MITLGEIFRHHGPAYRAQFGERMLPSQHAAMRAIEACRTEALGGPVYTCPSCATTRYSYHSCRTGNSGRSLGRLVLMRARAHWASGMNCMCADK